MQYDLDINDIDSVQFVNHYMPLEANMQILTDDEFDTKLEELLEFVFGPEPLKFIIFFYESGVEWIYDTLSDALAVTDYYQYLWNIKLGYEKRRHTNEVIVALVLKEEYSFC